MKYETRRLFELALKLKMAKRKKHLKLSGCLLRSSSIGQVWVSVTAGVISRETTLGIFCSRDPTDSCDAASSQTQAMKEMRCAH